ncbi:MAG: type I-E CRISPR-associated protein Cas6/Cse3/CasE [Rhodobacteraceae bacterium]|nr:type I-E CRISPR-associated protein Cas6/Cse3/CasE [Paracoccaceae bacterium]
MTLYLSRLRLSRSPGNRALDALLMPEDKGQRSDANHRLLWTVFSDGPDRTRDFLWRQEGPGLFLTLSARPPADHDLFERHEVKAFDPALSAGQRLGFVLRANATRTEKTGTLSSGGKEKRRHIDLVMDALHPLPRLKDLPPGTQSPRADARLPEAARVAETWLARQGAQHGFTVQNTRLEDYSTVEVMSARKANLPRARNKRPYFGVLDIAGEIEVTDPAAFLAQLPVGFGRAKSYGCGLMLIRRAG